MPLVGLEEPKWNVVEVLEKNCELCLVTISDCLKG